jgi:hypothetical protein
MLPVLQQWVSSVTIIEIPPALYQRLQRVAQLTQRPMDELVRMALEAGVPPLPEDLPEDLRADLLALEALDDEALRQVAQSQEDESDSARHSELLAKNAEGTILPGEREALAGLREAADRRMLRKAYASVLLKWRGHRLPAIAGADDAM